MANTNCDREGCSNIMSEYESEKHGYLCGECFETLLTLGINTNIEKFMGTTPRHSLMRSLKAEERFTKVFAKIRE